jgi:hypothetical protein
MRFLLFILVHQEFSGNFLDNSLSSLIILWLVIFYWAHFVFFGHLTTGKFLLNFKITVNRNCNEPEHVTVIKDFIH